MQNLFILLFSLLTVVGCSTNQTNIKEIVKDTTQALAFPVQPLFIDSGEEEGWGADIRLSITSINTTNNATIYKTQSTYKSKTVGLSIEFLDSNQNSLTFKSSGAISDNLLITLSQLYKLKTDTTNHFVKSLDISFIDLHSFAKEKFGTSDTLGQMAPKEYKLFFRGQTEKDYAEFYLNINDKEHWLELREKDPEYRPLLISFLSGQ